MTHAEMIDMLIAAANTCTLCGSVSTVVIDGELTCIECHCPECQHAHLPVDDCPVSEFEIYDIGR